MSLIKNVLHEIKHNTDFTIIDVTTPVTNIKRCIGPIKNAAEYAGRGSKIQGLINTIYEMLLKDVKLICEINDETDAFLRIQFEPTYAKLVALPLIGTRFIFIKNLDGRYDLTTFNYMDDFKHMYRAILRCVEHKNNEMCNTCMTDKWATSCGLCGYNNCDACVTKLFEIFVRKYRCDANLNIYECPQCRANNLRCIK